ncbi:MAG: hypothetical protein AAF599_21485, partial [Bacteroidota bacterium]
MKSILTTLFLMLCVALLFGQGMKKVRQPIKGNTNSSFDAGSFQPAINLAQQAKPNTRLQQAPHFQYRPMPKANFTKQQDQSLKVIQRSSMGLPIFIQGQLEQEDLSKSMEARAYDYLAALEKILPIQNVRKEFKIHRQGQDELGQMHLRTAATFECAFA